MTAIPAIIGGVGSLLGGIFGSSSASKQAKAELQAGRDQRDFSTEQFGLGSLGQLAAMLGPEGIQRWLAQSPQALRDKIVGVKASSPTFSREQQQRAEELQRLIDQPTAVERRPGEGPGISRQLGNSQGTTATAAQKKAWQAELDALTTAAGGKAGRSGLIDLEALKALGPGLLGQYQSLADEAGTQRISNLSNYDAQTAGLDRQARDIIAQSRKYGQGREAAIRRDSERSLQNANQAATAALNSRGLGASSALLDAYGGNAESNQRGLNDALSSLGDSQMQMRNGLQTGRLGLLTSRAGGRTALDLGGQDTRRSLQTGALNFQQGALANSDYSRQLGAMSPNFFPAASPSAAGLNSLGSSLSGVGSALLGYGLGNYGGGGQQQTLEQMRLEAARRGGMPYP